VQKVSRCHGVMWPWPIYLAPKWPLYVLSICENPVQNIKVILINNYKGKWVWAFQWCQNWPSWTTFSSFGGWKLKKLLKIWNDDTLLWSFSDQQLPAGEFFVHIFRRQMWKCFEIIAYLCIIQWFPCNTWLTHARYVSSPKTAAYTIGKGITRS